MFRYYPIEGNVRDISDAEAHQLMNEICEQWEDEITPLGRLFMGVYDWDFSNTPLGMEINIPNLRTGGAVPKNEVGSAEFGFEIFGDCFLKLG